MFGLRGMDNPSSGALDPDPPRERGVVTIPLSSTRHQSINQSTLEATVRRKKILQKIAVWTMALKH